MSRVYWQLVIIASRVLEPGEREAVRGDFVESRETGGKALLGVVGLVARRQAGLWMEWRPWLALLGLVVPVGLLLSLVCGVWSEHHAIDVFMYVDKWSWDFLGPVYRHDLVHRASSFLLNCFTLICWSWTTGFVLGSLSRRAIAINGTLFSVLLVGQFLAMPLSHHPFNAPVFALPAYGVVFPLVLRAGLVLLPSFLGMRKGFRVTTLPLPQTILWALATVTTTALAANTLVVSVISWDHFAGSGPTISWQLRLLPVVMAWPVAYMVVTAGLRRWRSGSSVVS